MPNIYHIKVTNDSKPPISNGCYNIKVRIKYLKKKVQSIGVHVHKDHWDESSGNIKLKHIDKYINQKKYIDSIYERIADVKVDLINGKISVPTAFNILLDKNTKEGSIIDWVKQCEPTAKCGQSTIDKHIQNINALNGWLTNGYSPITFEHLQDEEAIGSIATQIIRGKKSLSKNYQASLMTSLNWVTSKAKLKLKNPFTEYNHRVGYIPSKKNVPIDMIDFVSGLNNINTLHQFESALFWLYSFCYLGLDGIDIAKISEENIITPDYKLIDYIPDADALGNKDYITPVHLKVVRKKSIEGVSEDTGVDAVFQCNLFPTLIIQELLKHCIQHNDPDNAYTGKDKLRLFKFDPYTTEGAEKWKAKRNSYNQSIGAKIGTTNQRTRHTITKVAYELNMDKDKIDLMLNHKVKGVIKHYFRSEQTEQDVFQIHIFQEWNLLKCVALLLEKFENRTEFINGKNVSFIPESILHQRINRRKLPRLHRTQMLYQIKDLTKFSREDEMKYKTLMRKMAKGDLKIVNGEITKVAITEKKYPKVLKDLIAKRKKLYAEKRYIKVKGKMIELRDDFNPKIEFIDEEQRTKGKVVSLNKRGA